MAEHSPGKVIYNADWRELKLKSNGVVIAVLPAPHPKCRGKERMEDLACIRANGERLAALWNAAADAPTGFYLATHREVTPTEGNEPRVLKHEHVEAYLAQGWKVRPALTVVCPECQAAHGVNTESRDDGR